MGKDYSLPNFNLFTVQSVEGTCQFLKLPTPPHRTTTHECILLTNGNITRSLGLDTFTVDRNSIFFLPAGQITTIEAISADAKGFYCHFDASVLIKKFINLHLINEFGFLRTVTNPSVEISKKHISNLTLLFKRLSEEYQKNNNEDLIQSYLLTILLEIKPHFQAEKVRPISPAVYLTDRFKELITVNYKTNSMVSDYANILNVSPNHLTKSITAVTGKTPTQWIDELLALEAKVLLYQSQVSISEVSYELGIDDPSYFGRMFKKYTDKTPSEFRKQYEK
ncbi:MAG: AraC family transcriptional regulator [Ginsengibacter sp.]